VDIFWNLLIKNNFACDVNIIVESFESAEAVFVLICLFSDSGSRGCCDYVLTVLSVVMFICTLPLSLFFTLKVG